MFCVGLCQPTAVEDPRVLQGICHLGAVRIQERVRVLRDAWYPRCRHSPCLSWASVSDEVSCFCRLRTTLDIFEKWVLGSHKTFRVIVRAERDGF